MFMNEKSKKIIIKSDWVPCLGKDCKTKINLNVSNPITGYCSDCNEDLETSSLK